MTYPPSHNKTPIVICGPSGSGKSTLLKRLLAENKDKLAFTISHTTRKPRDGEVNGREYYFVSRQEFDRMIANNEFIEHTEFSGNLYGTSKRAIQEALKTDKQFIMEVDVEGVKALNNIEGLNPRFIFIKPPSKQLLMERLSSRGTETVEALKRRLDRADDEIKFSEDGTVQFDLILVNDDLEETYAKLRRFLKL
jgi:guanylate kinase